MKKLKGFVLLILFSSISLSALAASFVKQNPKAIIFDCDGVLVDTEYLKFLAWEYALARENIKFTLEEYMPLVGHSSKNILKGIRQKKGLDIDEKIIAVRSEKYRFLQEEGVPPITQMIEFVCKLSEKKDKLGFKIALASSAPTEEIWNNLRQVGLESVFDLVISGSDDLDTYFDIEGKNKPKPYIYIECAKRLGVLPAECLVFEDTAAGVEAAFGAGMTVIAVPNRFTLNQDFSKASQIIYSHSNLPHLGNFQERVLYTENDSRIGN